MMNMLKKNIHSLLGFSQNLDDSPLAGGLSLVIAADNNMDGNVVECARVKPSKSHHPDPIQEHDQINYVNNNINMDDDGGLGIEKRKMKKKSFPPPLSSFNMNGQRLCFLHAVRKEGRLELIQVRIHRPEIIHARRDGRLTIHLIPHHHLDNHQELHLEEEQEKEENVITLVEEEEESNEIIKDIKKLEEEEEEEEWNIMMRGSSSSSSGEGMRRCHDQVVNHGRHHRHHHHMQMCGVGIM